MKTSVSDGRLEIFDSFLERWQPPVEIDPAERVVIDTSLPIERSLEELMARTPSWSR